MSAYLVAGFDTRRLVGGMDLMWVGPGTGHVALAGTHAHRDLSPVMGSGNYRALVDAINAQLGSAPLSLSFDSTTKRYTFVFSDPLSVVFNDLTTPGGRNLAAALGFDYRHPRASGGSASDPYAITLSGPAGSYEGNVAPYYLLELARPGPSDYSRPYEVSGQTKRGISNRGRAYSIGPRTREERIKFTLKFNTLASTFAREADPDAPWTYEHLVKHTRCREPILLSYPAEELVYKNTQGEFDESSRQSVWKDYHGRWDLAVEGQFLGYL